MTVKLTSSPTPLSRDKALIGRTVRVVRGETEAVGTVKQWGAKLICIVVDGKGRDWPLEGTQVFPIYVEATEDAPAKPKRAPRARKAPASS
jgi:hypothetical protein